MFKKKCALPPRPLVPSAEQILADITEVGSDDPVLHATARSEDISGIASNSENVYKELKRFFERNQKLCESLSHVKSLHLSAETESESVLKISEELKEQALKSLQ